MNPKKQLPTDAPASHPTDNRGGILMRPLMRLVLCVGLAMAALSLAAQLLG